MSSPAASPRIQAAKPVGGRPLLAHGTHFLERLERSLGVVGASVVVGLLLLALAAVYVTPALETVNHGKNFEKLSVRPFDLGDGNPVRLRILTPLVAHLVFLRGELYIFAPLLAGIAFLAAIYVYFRRRDFSPLESAGVAALMAFSTPILFTLHFQGYTDTTSYLLLFLCLIGRNVVVRALLFALALLNHEANVFALPFLLYRPWVDERPLRAIAVALPLFLFAFAPALWYRDLVMSHAPVLYSSDFYLNPRHVVDSVKQIARLLPMGVFAAFGLFWCVVVLAAGVAVSRKKYGEAAWIALVVCCALGQLLVATDTSRLVGLAFPAFLLGAQFLKTYAPSFAHARGVWILILWNLLVPVYYVGQDQMYPLIPLPVSIALHLLGYNPWELWWK